MRLSLEWLSQYVAIPEAIALAERLTMAGLEVEGVERPAEALHEVVVAEVRACEDVPETHLHACKVFDGQGVRDVVCGAPNVAAGQKVALALPGAVLGGKAIADATIKGRRSSGMICSERELGMSDAHAGILVLPPDAVPGTPIARALGLDDTIFEVKATPNRPDWLSHFGIAREVAALTGAKLVSPAVNLVESGAPVAGAASVTLEAPDRCPRYVARVIEGVKVGPSPRWLTRRLEAAGVRAINNVVDVTNYVLMELGQPLHAFDLDRVHEGRIVVRLAREGESLTTLDGKPRALSTDDLVIADPLKALALAGVMGGSTSEVTDGTTRLLLESAHFTGNGIRRTARRHALHSEAAHRFERGADPELARFAADRAAELFALLCGGSVRAGAVDEYPRPIARKVVPLRAGAAKRLLGVDVAQVEATRILVALGCEVVGSEKWRAPSWRPDLSEEADLVEELGRVRGFELIPSVPTGMPALPTPLTPDDEAVAAARASLSASGLHEALNYSFVSPASLAALSADAGAIRVQNPLTIEQAAMRTTVLASLLTNVRSNLAHGAASVRLYELGRVYLPGGDTSPAREPRRLAFVRWGLREPMAPEQGKAHADFRDAKALVEALADALGVSLTYAPASDAAPHLHPVSATAVSLGGARLGTFGELHPLAAKALDLPRGVWAGELDADALLGAAKLHRNVTALPRFPAVLRDLAIVVDESVTVAEVDAAIRAAETSLVEAVTLFDVYRGQPLPPGKKNLAYAIRYRAPDRTLTDAEAQVAHARLLERLTAQLGAALRS